MHHIKIMSCRLKITSIRLNYLCHNQACNAYSTITVNITNKDMSDWLVFHPSLCVCLLSEMVSVELSALEA